MTRIRRSCILCYERFPTLHIPLMAVAKCIELLRWRVGSEVLDGSPQHRQRRGSCGAPRTSRKGRNDRENGLDHLEKKDTAREPGASK